MAQGLGDGSTCAQEYYCGIGDGYIKIIVWVFDISKPGLPLTNCITFSDYFNYALYLAGIFICFL